MLRVLVLATLFATSQVDVRQALSVLHIKVVVLDAARNVIPVPRHVLLVSDNPATAPPRRIITAPDGTATVKLRPGNYTVESDRPVAFEGKAYQWMQIVDIDAGRDAVLELTIDNAEVVAPDASAATSASQLEDDPSSLLTRWQASIVAIWTPTAHASGFLIDVNGLIATTQRAIGAATSVEVQLTANDKVAARVVVADRERDVAVLKINARTAAAMRPVPLGCAQALPTPIVEGQQIVAIEAPLRQQKGTISGTVSRVRVNVIESDLVPATGGAGGPVFMAGGSVIGIVAVADDREDQTRSDARVVRIAEVCEVVARAQKNINDAAAADSTQLPVEPVRAFPLDALKDAAERRASSLIPYQMSSSDFDIALMTPLQIYAAQERPGQMYAPPLRDFSNWSEYVEQLRPVLLVRVTPKLVEGFWTRVARGAAQTQGVSLPPIKRLKSGFSRMRAFCGDAEITPIHALKLEHRIPEKDAIYEGLYVLAPGALAPTCASVRLLLYSDNDPDKPDTLVVDAKVVEQIWQDFAPHRALSAP